MLECINIKQKDGRTPNSVKINQLPCAQSYKGAHKELKKDSLHIMTQISSKRPEWTRNY